MSTRARRWDWMVSCALFAAILLALVVGALVLNPLAATVP